jgi:hypothetical protein
MEENWCKSREHELFFDTPTEDEVKEIAELVKVISCKKCPFRVVTHSKLTDEDLEWAKEVMEKAGYI